VALAYVAAKIAAYLPISADINYIIARILRQMKFNEHKIFDKKVGDDHQILAKNPMFHSLSGRWPFG
jgi:hypothetical protein